MVECEVVGLPAVGKLVQVVGLVSRLEGREKRRARGEAGGDGERFVDKLKGDSVDDQFAQARRDRQRGEQAAE